MVTYMEESDFDESESYIHHTPSSSNKRAAMALILVSKLFVKRAAMALILVSKLFVRLSFCASCALHDIVTCYTSIYAII